MINDILAVKEALALVFLNVIIFVFYFIKDDQFHRSIINNLEKDKNNFLEGAKFRLVPIKRNNKLRYLILLLTFILDYVLLCFFSPDFTLYRFILISLILLALFLGWIKDLVQFFYLTTKEVFFDEEQIYTKFKADKPSSKQEIVSWENLKKAKFPTGPSIRLLLDNTCVLIAEDRKKIRISRLSSGMKQFLNIMRENCKSSNPELVKRFESFTKPRNIF